MVAPWCPKHELPVLPVPINYPEDVKPAIVGPGIARDASEIAWCDYFVEPYLQTLIVKALASNRDLRQAVLRIKEAQVLYRIGENRGK